MQKPEKMSAEMPLLAEAHFPSEDDFSIKENRPLVDVPAWNRDSEKRLDRSIADQETRPLAVLFAESWNSGRLSEGSIADEATRPLVAILVRPLAVILTGNTGNLSEQSDAIDEDTVLMSAIRRSRPEKSSSREQNVADQDTVPHRFKGL